MFNVLKVLEMDNMEWFNVFGLIFIVVIMIPNIVFAIRCKDEFDNKWNNKYIEIMEQVGRIGCFGFIAPSHIMISHRNTK